MDLSIIIINYNSTKLLEKCISSIVRSNPMISYEIIVIDNNSESFPQMSVFNDAELMIIMNKENVGYGKANNQGVKKAKGKYILFLNVDTEVLDDGIDSLYSFITESKNADIVGGKLLNIDKTDQPSCGPFYSLPIVFAMLFLKGDTWGLTRYSPSKLKRVDWISGACIMIKKSDFVSIDMFDENIFMYMDEIDLLFRASKKDLQTYFYPNAKFIHIGAATSKSTAQPILNIYEGLLYFYNKHANGIQCILLKAMLFTKAWVAIVVGIVTQNNELTDTYKKAKSLI